MYENLKMKEKLLFTSGEFAFHPYAKNVNVTTQFGCVYFRIAKVKYKNMRVTINSLLQ